MVGILHSFQADNEEDGDKFKPLQTEKLKTDRGQERRQFDHVFGWYFALFSGNGRGWRGFANL